jgi:hypothetical protein
MVVINGLAMAPSFHKEEPGSGNRPPQSGQDLRNERLAGQKHPVTGVFFKENGYPAFESIADIIIPEELRGPEVSDARQFADVPSREGKNVRCTIYSPVVDHQAVGVVRDVLPGWLLHWEGEPERWSSASFTSAQGTLKFNSLEFTGPMDPFGKIILGTSSYFWRREDLAQDTKKELIRFVGGTRWLVGVVGTSEVLSEDVSLKAALELARHLNGRVFNGTDLLSPEPRL